jgi:hypothetical protein
MTRPRLQLHLSTLLIVTVLAAGLVWLNVREWWMPDDYFLKGWPIAYIKQSAYYAYHDWRHLALDVAFSLTLLAVAAAAIEWATRRMKRGAP